MTAKYYLKQWYVNQNSENNEQIYNDLEGSMLQPNDCESSKLAKNQTCLTLFRFMTFSLGIPATRNSLYPDICVVIFLTLLWSVFNFIF